jgi:hypothetical protein
MVQEARFVPGALRGLRSGGPGPGGGHPPNASPAARHGYGEHTTIRSLSVYTRVKLPVKTYVNLLLGASFGA